MIRTFLLTALLLATIGGIAMGQSITCTSHTSGDRTVGGQILTTTFDLGTPAPDIGDVGYDLQVNGSFMPTTFIFSGSKLVIQTMDPLPLSGTVSLLVWTDTDVFFLDLVIVP